MLGDGACEKMGLFGECMLGVFGIKLGRLDYTSIFASVDLVVRQYWLLLESAWRGRLHKYFYPKGTAV